MDRYYYAYSKEEIEKSASGGIGYALAAEMVREGIVYGVAYSSDFRQAEYIRIDRKEKLELIRGSKYIRAEKKMADGTFVFERIRADLEQNRRVLFTGLPCEVGALNLYLKKQNTANRGNLITADLICQGPLGREEQASYLAFLEEKYKSRVTEFSVRYKNPYWKPVYLRAVFENGKEHIRPLYDTDFGRALLFYGKEACFQCRYKGEKHGSDLTIGDFWGMEEGEEAYQKMGMSVVITHTEKGDTYFQNLPRVVKGVVTKEQAIDETSMYARSRKKAMEYEKFRNVYREKSLHAAVFAVRSPLSKMKYAVQRILGMKPY